MSYDEPDPTDPQELIGVVLPSDPEAGWEMAYVFAEEFARLGHDAPQILRMFQNPFYAGAHGAYQALGHEAVVRVIDECHGVWGRVRMVDVDGE